MYRARTPGDSTEVPAGDPYRRPLLQTPNGDPFADLGACSHLKKIADEQRDVNPLQSSPETIQLERAEPKQLELPRWLGNLGTRKLGDSSSSPGTCFGEKDEMMLSMITHTELKECRLRPARKQSFRSYDDWSSVDAFHVSRSRDEGLTPLPNINYERGCSVWRQLTD